MPHSPRLCRFGISQQLDRRKWLDTGQDWTAELLLRAREVRSWKLLRKSQAHPSATLISYHAESGRVLRFTLVLPLPPGKACPDKCSDWLESAQPWECACWWSPSSHFCLRYTQAAGLPECQVFASLPFIQFRYVPSSMVDGMLMAPLCLSARQDELEPIPVQRPGIQCAASCRPHWSLTHIQL